MLSCVLAALGMQACSDNNDSVEPSFAIRLNGSEVTGTDLQYSARSIFSMFVVESNTAWTLSKDAEWLTLSNTAGDATLTDWQKVNLKVSLTKNETATARTAHITMSAGGQNKVLTITQRGLYENDPSGWESAANAAVAIGAGVNIGNTLDAWGTWFSSDDPADFETCWGNPQITPALIQSIHAAGFRAVRIPVTWFPHLTDDGTVQEAWMQRVQQVVDYVMAEDGMYCVIDVHHDTGADASAWVLADMDNIDDIAGRLSALWTQIATRFRDYDERLLFEGYNEVLDASHSWNRPVLTRDYEALSRLAQTFVDAVRATGGNNAVRNLIINPYSCAPTLEAFEHLTLPTDAVPNHLAMSVHLYSPNEFCDPKEDAEPPVWTADYEAQLDAIFDVLASCYSERGVPMIIGEWGTNSRVDDSEAAKYAAHFMQRALAQNAAAFHWYDLFDRTTGAVRRPLTVTAITEAIK